MWQSTKMRARPGRRAKSNTSRRRSGRLGEGGAKPVPLSAHGEWQPSSERPGPRCPPRGAGHHAGAGAGPDPLRPNVGLAVHVLPWRCLFDGLRPGHRAPNQPVRATVRGCASVQLRRLRRPGPALVFSVNDFDETLPGPFEWDVKRLVASFAVAGRDRGFDAKQRKSINLARHGRTARRCRRWRR